MTEKNLEGGKAPSGMSPAGGMPANQEETPAMIRGHIVKIDTTNEDCYMLITIAVHEKYMTQEPPVELNYYSKAGYEEALREYINEKASVRAYNNKIDHLHIGEVFIKQEW